MFLFILFSKRSISDLNLSFKTIDHINCVSIFSIIVDLGIDNFLMNLLNLSSELSKFRNVN